MVYVNDIIITGSSSSLLQTIISKLNVVIFLKQLGGLDYILNIEVKQAAKNSLILTQSKYIKDFILKTNMMEAYHVHTPIQFTCKLAKISFATLIDPSMYMSIIGGM